MLRETFAHSFIYEKNGQILQGAEGTLEDVAIKVSDIEKVLGLSFDLDVKDFHGSFRRVYVDYLGQVMPKLGLIQTSPDGDMHGRVRFKKPISVANAKKYYCFLKDFLFADTSSPFVMPYRVPGFANSKHGDFVVKELNPPEKVTQDDFEELLRPHEGEDRPRWYEISFQALFAVVKLEGRPYWQQGRKNGICPIHGTGANPGQCTYEPKQVRCLCWADCKDASSESPKLITYPQILRKLVFNCDINGRFPMADTEGDTLFWRPDSEEKINELIQRLSDTKQYVRFGDVLCRIFDGRLVPLDGVSPASIGRGWSTSLDVKIYNPKTGEVGNYNFKAPEVENILAVYLHRFPSIKVRLNRSALKANFTWSKRGLDGDYFTQNPIRPLTGKAGDYPHLNYLLDMWNFKSDVDRTNTVAMFLDRLFTGVSRFDGKHLVTIVSGNQQGVGKTELANCVLYLAQGETTTVLMENEVRKADFERQILPKIKDIPVSAILVDNVTGGVGGVFDSSNLVSMMTGQRLALRIFHSQRLFNLPNNFQWIITTNGANYSDDLIERSILVEIHHEGKPKFGRTTPLEYVEKYCQQLHSEIKGMYDYWVAQGKPRLELNRRNHEFFTLLNSILTTCGFEGFDTNRKDLEEASSDPDKELLLELYAVLTGKEGSNSIGITAGKILPHLPELMQNRVCGDGNKQSQATKLGYRLGNLVDRDIRVEDKFFRLKQSKRNNSSHFKFQDVTEARNHEPSEPHPVLKTPVRIDQTAVDTTVSQIDSESPYNIGDDLNGIFD